MTSKKSATVAGKPGLSPVLPRVPLTLNSKEYHLVFSFNALARMEQLTGLNAFGTFDFSNLTATNLRAMLFATLLTENPDITLEETGELIQPGDVGAIYEALLKAWVGSQPEKKDNKENPPSAE